MELDRVVKALSLESSSAILATGWEDSQATLPEGEVLFLTRPSIIHACQECRIPEQVCAATMAAAERIATNPAARALGWHFHHCLYHTPAYPRSVPRWPSLDRALGDDGRMLYLLVLLSGLPELEQRYRQRGIPVEVLQDTVSDVTRWLGGDEDGPMDPPWGIHTYAVSWLTFHFRGDLYRLGRLQFLFQEADHRVRVFRQRRTRAVLALSEDGVCYRADGGDMSEGMDSFPGTWTSRLKVSASSVTGNPITPEGRALQGEVTLATSQWEEVLKPGDLVLSFHIPAGTPLDHAQCGRSFQRAREFFPAYFPDQPIRAFVCTSWLLNTELQELLPDGSNMVRFQREFYLLPVPQSPSVLLRVAMGRDEIDPATAPRKTALQRAILDRISQGTPFMPAAGGCFLLPEDLDWGSQVYLHQPRPEPA